MRKPFPNFSKCLCLSSIALLLVACSGTSSSSASHTITFTVHFFDDAATPNDIGYCYCAKGEKAIFHNNNGSSYSFESQSTTAANPGYAYSFDEWTGTYENITDSSGTPVAVNISSIQGDCNVYANFVQKKLSYTVKFFNGSELMRDSAGKRLYEGVTFNFGDKITLPATDPTSEAKWGYENSFLGYKFDKEAHGFVPKDRYTNSASFYYGSGAPTEASVITPLATGASETPADGSFYEDTTNKKLYVLQESWVNEGDLTLLKTPCVNFYADYVSSARDFLIKFYPSETDFKNGTNASETTLKGTFGEVMTFTKSTGKLEVTYGGGSATNSLTLDPSKTWAFDYSNQASDYGDDEAAYTLYHGKKVNDTNLVVAAPIGCYPVA